MDKVPVCRIDNKGTRQHTIIDLAIKVCLLDRSDIYPEGQDIEEDRGGEAEKNTRGLKISR